MKPKSQKLDLEAAARLVQPRDSLLCGFVAGQPVGFLEALGARTDLEDVVLYTGLLTRPFALLQNPGVRVVSGFFGPIERMARAAGARVSYLPADFSGLERRALRMKPRVALAVTSPPDREGWLSFGVQAGASYRPFLQAARDPARLAIAEVNPRMPRIDGVPELGGNRVHLSEVDAWVEHETELVTLPEEPPSPEELAIARRVCDLIQPEAILQFGIGAIPDEIARILAERPAVLRHGRSRVVRQRRRGRARGAELPLPQVDGEGRRHPRVDHRRRVQRRHARHHAAPSRAVGGHRARRGRSVRAERRGATARADRARASRLSRVPTDRRMASRGNPMSERASDRIDGPSPREVVVRGSAAGFAQEIVVGAHRLAADEPTSAGGTDTGPNPYDLLLASLGSCTSMTVALYARRKGWPLEGVTVRLRHSRIHAADCADCETREGMIDRIERDIELAGALTDEQRARLLEIAGRCPVHRTLAPAIDLRTP